MIGIKYPIFQGGMAWIADANLAAAVSNGGGLGIISAMNADAEYLRGQIVRARELTDEPFGVNIMLMSPFADEVAQIAAEEKVKVITTGAGNPTKYMKLWKDAGITVVPVVASCAMAKMVERAGADAVIPADTSESFAPWRWFRRSRMPFRFPCLPPEESPTDAELRHRSCSEQSEFSSEHVSSSRANAEYIRITRMPCSPPGTYPR